MKKSNPGERIREFRNRKGLTLNELGKRYEELVGSSITSQYLGLIERGSKKPSDEALLNILSSLGCNVREKYEIFSAFEKKLPSLLEFALPEEKIKKHLESAEESWIISSYPLELSNETIYDETVSAIREGISLTYFIPEKQVIRFWSLLENKFNRDWSGTREKINQKIKCISGPAEIGWFSTRIFNPRTNTPKAIFSSVSSLEKKFNSDSKKRYENIYDSIDEGIKTELVSDLSSPQLTMILSHLIPIYERVVRNPKETFKGYRLEFP